MTHLARRARLRAALHRLVPVLLLLLALVTPTVYSQEAPRLRVPDWSHVADFPQAPELTARAAILVDVTSATVLYARNPDLVIPAASLTKLVAIDAALRAVERGEISLAEEFTPPPTSWAENQPPGSSLMFLGPDQRLDYRELLLGLSVSSGNDAAVALAERLDGSVPAFAERMNRSMRELGLVDLSFVEPSGLSPHNTITARGFARFLLAHLERFPEATDEYYSPRTYTYPDDDNRVGPEARAPITQWNRNTLLREFAGVDGFKTGFVDESGYHLAATAERDGRRLIAIVLGIDAHSHAVGGAIRAAEAGRLLDYGFERFVRLTLGYPRPRPVRVYGGREREVVPEGPQEIVIAVPSGAEERIHGLLDQHEAVTAPLPRVAVGSVSVELDGVILASEPLVLPTQEQGGFFRRLWDGIVLAVRRIGSWFAEVELPVSEDELSAVQ